MNAHHILCLTLLMTVTAPGHAGEPTDPRQKIDMPAMMQNHMKQNMRDHLLALSEIEEALGANQYGKAADIAEQRLGMTSLQSHGAEHMAPFMPTEMQAIGTEMHHAASRFAVSVRNAEVTADLRPAMTDLSKVSRQCVACHAAYRIH
jgi:cytochrome c556